ncbi:MAG: imidazoleglycerol-phosphate dehydratase HisB [Spirochaetaceae bacterium]
MTSKQERTTKETSITLSLDLSQAPEPEVETGLPFLDHMLRAMSFHGNLGLKATARGDLEVDAHHTVEDLGIVLGDALREIRDAHPAIRRFGHAAVPMDDSLAEVTVDFGGRAYLVCNLPFPQEYAGTFQLPLLREFFHGLAAHGLCNLHINGRYGENGHHLAEAAFKALGLAIQAAFTPGPYRGAASTKGSV